MAINCRFGADAMVVDLDTLDGNIRQIFSKSVNCSIEFGDNYHPVRVILDNGVILRAETSITSSGCCELCMMEEPEVGWTAIIPNEIWQAAGIRKEQWKHDFKANPLHTWIMNKPLLKTD